MKDSFMPYEEFEFNPGKEVRSSQPHVEDYVVHIQKIDSRARVYTREWNGYLSPKQMDELRSFSCAKVHVGSAYDAVPLINKAKSSIGFNAYLTDPRSPVRPKYRLYLNLDSETESVKALQTALFTSFAAKGPVPFETGSVRLLKSVFDLVQDLGIGDSLVIEFSESQNTIPFVDFINMLTEQRAYSAIQS